MAGESSIIGALCPGVVHAPSVQKCAARRRRSASRRERAVRVTIRPIKLTFVFFLDPRLCVQDLVVGCVGSVRLATNAAAWNCRKRTRDRLSIRRDLRVSSLEMLAVLRIWLVRFPLHLDLGIARSMPACPLWCMEASKPAAACTPRVELDWR